jgi:hypothetical protein
VEPCTASYSTHSAVAESGSPTKHTPQEQPRTAQRETGVQHREAQARNRARNSATGRPIARSSKTRKGDPRRTRVGTHPFQRRPPHERCIGVSKKISKKVNWPKSLLRAYDAICGPIGFDMRSVRKVGLRA